MLGGLPGSTLVSNWFVSRRGTALGIAATGISLSGVLMPPLATMLIADQGWRFTFIVYGVAVFVFVLPVVWFVIVKNPHSIDG